jgi:thymidylate kinase
MAMIALIGPDGVGKTTLCGLLRESSPRFKYVYMGINYSASNVSLPTTRLAARWSGNKRRFGGLRPLLRLANLLAEEWYRQLVCWWHEARGKAILCDRHFVFDFAAPDGSPAEEPLAKRLHRWFIACFYPRPDLVVLLDAPSEVVYARKGEFNLEILERRRKILREQAARCPNAVLVNTNRPLERVYEEVAAHVTNFLSGENYAASADVSSRGRATVHALAEPENDQRDPGGFRGATAPPGR